MKIIIVEGTDRTGKDTLINELKNLYRRTMIIHCGVPDGENNDERNHSQYMLFNGYLNLLYDDAYMCLCDCIIYNRFWYGEYVYGQLYRNRDKKEVLKFVSDLEFDLLNINNNTLVHENYEVYYIQLINDSIKLRTLNDDGNSMTTDIDIMNRETELFKEIFNVSKIEKKILINVNNGDMFRDKNEILEQVKNFIDEN